MHLIPIHPNVFTRAEMPAGYTHWQLLKSEMNMSFPSNILLLFQTSSPNTGHLWTPKHASESRMNSQATSSTPQLSSFGSIRRISRYFFLPFFLFFEIRQNSSASPIFFYHLTWLLIASVFDALSSSTSWEEVIRTIPAEKLDNVLVTHTPPVLKSSA